MAKRRTAHNPTHSTNPLPGMYPNPLQNITGVESSCSPGVTGVSCYPPWAHTFSHIHTHITPRVPRGFLIAPDQNNSHRLPQLSATGTRVAICGVLWPGGLPYPCPGQIAHQWPWQAERNVYWGLLWLTAILPKRPFGLHWGLGQENTPSGQLACLSKR
jgi:hypothetical protein